MNLTERQLRKLEAIVTAAQAILSEAKASSKEKVVGRKRFRRSGKELVAFRKMLLSERKKGVSAVEIAKKHNVSTAYIYQI